MKFVNSPLWITLLVLNGCGGSDAKSSDAAPAGEAGAPAGPIVEVDDIGGQSNAVGLGVLTAPWPGDTLVTYFLNGVATPFGTAANGTHGPELGLGPALTVGGQRLTINKSAVSGHSCASLTTTDWPAHAAGIAAVRGLGTRYNFEFVQGETDAEAPASPALQAQYETCLRLMLSMVRGAFGGPVRAHILLLNQYLDPVTFPGLDSIRAAEAAVVYSDENADLVSMDDEPPASGLLHYGSAQLLELGRRFADMPREN